MMLSGVTKRGCSTSVVGRKVLMDTMMSGNGYAKNKGS